MTIGIGTFVVHPHYGEGIIRRENITNFEIFFEKGGKVEISKENEELEIIDTETEEITEKYSSPSYIKDIEELILNTLDKYNALPVNIELGEKWTNGTLILKPGNENLQAKELPIETFFHKIVMLRDKLRVLEQNINTHKKLSDEEKVHLQQYITKCYGSLTSFNILFADKNDHFTGQKK